MVGGQSSNRLMKAQSDIVAVQNKFLAHVSSVLRACWGICVRNCKRIKGQGRALAVGHCMSHVTR
eukprot:5177998-Amphidinium_carterae.1